MAILNVNGHNPYQPQGVFPRRGGRVLTGTCIVHTSEGNWRSGVNSLTNLIKTRTDYGAYHRAVDWEDIAIYFDWEWEAWQDSETNPWAVGISAACKTSDWGTPEFVANKVEEGFYRNLARCAADFVVYMNSAKGIVVPLRRISGAQARAGVPGFCAHGDSGIARSDPGSKFDWDRFFLYVQEALNPTVNKGWLEMLSDAEQQELLENSRAVRETVNKIANQLYGDQQIAQADLYADRAAKKVLGKVIAIKGENSSGNKTSTVEDQLSWLEHNIGTGPKVK